MTKKFTFQKVFINSFIILILVFALSLFVSAEPSKIRYYGETDDIFNNPERGWRTNRNINQNNDWNRNLERIYENGQTILRAPIRLDDYRNKPIPQQFLDDLDDGFNAVRQYGLKVIPRFMYNAGPIGAPDASKEIILTHINQVDPLLQKHADVIAAMEAGFIGAWGEWHSSTNELDNPNDMGQITNALLKALPKDRMLMIRYPYKKAAIFNTYDDIKANDAYDGSDRSRTGLHNDCFLANEGDAGTYGSSPAFPDPNHRSVQEWKDWVAKETIYTVMTGETCQVTPERSRKDAILKEGAEQHWSIINRDFYLPNIDYWISKGWYDEISRKLGYRFKLISANFPDNIKSGSQFNFKITLQNEGWASLFNPRPVYAVISGNADRLETKIELDPRKWEPGKESSFSANVQIPITFPEGVYDLALWMPDYYESLQSNSRYSIRFANEDVWDETNGYNKLGTITINTDALIEEPEEETDPEDIEEDVEIIHPGPTGQDSGKSKTEFFEKIIEFISSIWKSIFG